MVSSRQLPEVLRFLRVASQRFEEARFLLKHGYTTGAIYLGGYGAECMLKALILTGEPVSRHRKTLGSFRGAHAHELEWLKRELHKRRILLPAALVKSFAIVNKWNTRMRYDPRHSSRREAEAFLKEVERIMAWARGRI